MRSNNRGLRSGVSVAGQGGIADEESYETSSNSQVNCEDSDSQYDNTKQF